MFAYDHMKIRYWTTIRGSGESEANGNITQKKNHTQKCANYLQWVQQATYTLINHITRIPFYYKYSIQAIIIILYEVNLNHVGSISVYSDLIKQYVLPNYC